MLLDNKFLYDENLPNMKTVWDFICQSAKGREGKMDIVTGFFSVAGLNLLYRELHPENKYRLILGEITEDDKFVDQIIDLLQGDSAISSALHLSEYAQNAIAFLKRATVEVRTINNAFCHAKSYQFTDKADPMFRSFLVVGSSNLTEAGLGTKPSANIELNIVESGNTAHHAKELKQWFKQQWEVVAKAKIHINPIDKNSTLVDVKNYIIEQIEQVFRIYNPEEIYYKILFELFNGEIELNSDIQNERELTLLQDTVIYKTLFEYQKKGVISLIKMLRKYNGAILADAVGLGKTFSALAVMKYFQNNGYTVLLLCPKKLENNWTQYLKRHQSRFERDQFDYIVRFHTDLQANRLEDYPDAKLSYLQKRNKLLVVIDESHNLRNHKSGRYQTLLNELIGYNPEGRVRDIKVLQLSATPINNKLLDVRNQFNLIARGEDNYFATDDFGIDSLQALFKDAETKFQKWCGRDDRTINGLIASLSPKFFNLTDKLLVARTRALIERTLEEDLGFPKKDKPLNIYEGVTHLGEYKTVEEIYDALISSNLTAYQPSKYLELPSEQSTDEKEWDDNTYREMFLVKMMITLFLKRMESSWSSCKSTVEKVLKVHEDMLANVEAFLKDQKARKVTTPDAPDEGDDEMQEFTVGKRDINLADMHNIKRFRHDLKEDIKKLKAFCENMNSFADGIANGTEHDLKLERLIELVKEKQQKGNKKLIIFTAFSDTAKYIFDNLKDIPGLGRIACVDGSNAVDSTGQGSKKFDTILQRFAPYSKLYKERDWSELYEDSHCPLEYFNDEKDRWEVPYELWEEIVRKHDPQTTALLDRGIDILIATDCLSEGQNLQDADLVVNFDIHWNPVRLIQRFGRIDRIGSPNETVQCVNFWPTESYESYLHLEQRIVNRMTSMNLIGSETQDINETFEGINRDNPLIERNAEKLLSQLKDNSISEIEDSRSVSLQDFSFELYRQDLIEYFEKKKDVFRKMPNGIFTGFRVEPDLFTNVPESLVAVLGYPHREPGKKDHHYTEIYLICQPVEKQRTASYIELNRAEILDFLRKNRKAETYLPQWILKTDAERVKKLSDILLAWMEQKAPKQVIKNIKDILGSKKVKKQENILQEDKFKIENFDLIAWEYITRD